MDQDPKHTFFVKELANQYSEAIKICLLQYENLPADKAFELAKRFKFFYTPKVKYD